MAGKNKHISHVKSNVTVNTYVNKNNPNDVISEELYNKLPATGDGGKGDYKVVVSPKLPTADDIMYGEFAVNYADGYETLAIKNSANDIVQFKSEEYNENKYTTNEYIEENLGDIITNKTEILNLAQNETQLISLAENSETILALADDDVSAALEELADLKEQLDSLADISDNLEAMAGAQGDNGLLQKTTTTDPQTGEDVVEWNIQQIYAPTTAASGSGKFVSSDTNGNAVWVDNPNTDVTKVKVGNDTIDGDNTGNTVVAFAGDSNVGVSANTSTKTVTVGVAANSDLAGLIGDKADIDALVAVKDDLVGLAGDASDLADIADMKSDIENLVSDVSELGGLADVADTLEAIANAAGSDGVLKKETTTDPQTGETVVTWIIQDKGSAGDLTTGTSTEAKPWDAKTLTEYIASVMANATEFKGGFNADTGAIDGSADTLTTVAEAVGDVYTVTTAGTFAGKALQIGDSIVFKAAVAAGTAPVASDVIFVEGTVNVTDSDVTLSWGTKTKIADVEGTDIHVTLPSNPNTDATKAKVGNVTLSVDNTGLSVIEVEGDSNVGVSANSSTNKISVGVASGSDLAGLIGDKADIDALVAVKDDLVGLAGDASDLADIADMKSDLEGLTTGTTSATLEAMANASGANGVLTKTTNGDTVTWTVETAAAVNDGKLTVKTNNGSTDTTVAEFTANQSTDLDVKFVQGSNVTITPNATSKTITIAATDTTYGTFDTTTNGLVPMSGANTGKYLKGDGSWDTPTDTNTTYQFEQTANTNILTMGTDNGAKSAIYTPLTANTSQAGVVQLSDSTSSNVSTTAATSKAVKSAYDLASGKTAVTLNGAGSVSSSASFYAPIDSGTSGNVLKSSGSGAPTWGSISSSELPSNIVYDTLGELTSVVGIPVTNRVVIITISADASVSLNETGTGATTLNGGAEIHAIVINSGSSAITLTMPHGAGTIFNYVNTVTNTASSTLNVEAGQQAEINFLFGKTTSGVQTVYVRYV